MSSVASVLALVGVLVMGLLLGLAWRGSLFIGDRRALDRLSGSIEVEQRLREATHAAMQASRRVVREHQMPRRGAP